jgi:hypothetical protein
MVGGVVYRKLLFKETEFQFWNEKSSVEGW